ncbi:cohesin domain-containing protein [Clostridium cellulovorans]|uniref:Dockerin domain-containing protein n=1 Tax=Clostridium cellulovorans (strain ATCC 35296 / DSM 3052 / OCM 3 / 743B) TaxID=573061 RepID=D9SUN3_CLOC7|nr:hypothetical protein [Clostridium cellulovorans]ADL50938.1 hypothetical protein Clocel_1182 [Clostridium cellulovorans 743B]
MKNEKRIFTLILAMFMFLVFVSPNVAYAEAVTTQAAPTLTATPNNQGNYISLKWTTPDPTKNYSYMIYSKKSTDTEFQSIPAKSNVKVLNVYPGVGNNLKTWMETNGYGKGYISVDEVDIDTFNANPNSYLKDINGKWKYDVIYEGAWDSNNFKDLSVSATNAIEEFIKAGRGYLAGHDALYPYMPARNQLASYLNIIPTDYLMYGSTSVKINRKGLLTNYPWEIGDINTTLSVPLSHTGQYASGDVWIKYSSNSMNSNAEITSYNGKATSNNFYLTTWNNTAMIQTGHSNGEATPDEQKILANTLFYLAQVTEATSWDDHKGQDLDAPSKPNVTSVAANRVTNKTNITFQPSIDKGTTYDYYIEAKEATTSIKTNSQIKTATITSGLKGYSIVVDKNPSTVPTKTITTISTNYSIDGAVTEGSYVHVASIDNVGNVSEVSHYKYVNPILSLTLTPSTAELQRNPVTITAAAISTNTTITKIQTPDGNWVNGSTAKYVVSKTGDYTFTAVDELGNKITQKITVTIKPQPALSLTLTPSTRELQRNPVTITATATSTNTKIVKIQTPDGNWVNGSTASYVVSKNEDYEFTAVDELGNEITQIIKVTNIIPKAVLSMILTPSTTVLQRNFVITITASATSTNTKIVKIQTPDGNWVNGSTTNYIVSEDGDYKFTAVDELGDEVTQSIRVKVPPKPVLSMTLTPSTTELQRDPVTITASATSTNTKIVKIQTPDGNWVNGSTASYVVSKNEDYKFTAVDELGNEITQIIKVTNIIPKAVLSMILTPSTTVLQRNFVITITASATSTNTKIVKIQTPDGNWVNGSTTNYIVSASGYYKFTAVDDLGDEVTQSISVEVPPKPILSMKLTPSTTELQREPVTITASATSTNTKIVKIQTPDGNWVNGATVSYVVSENRDYIFTAVDELNNEITQSIKITNIIPKPVLSMTLTPSTTELQRNPVTITAVATSTNTKIVKIKTPDGNWVNGATVSYVVSENRDYIFTVVDELNNEITRSIKITNIIPKPVLSMALTPSITADTNGPVTISATATSTNTKIVKVQTPDGNWVDGSTVDYVVSANGTYKFTAVDELGNEITESVVVNNIFKVVLNVEPERNRIHLNETVTANLIIDNIKEIAAEDIRIKYDTTKLQFLGYEQVDGIKLMKSSSQNGELRFILVSKGLLNVVNSKTILLKLKFKGIAPGDGLVDVIKGRISDGILMEKNLKDVECGQVNINVADEELIDVNDDGEFSLLDLGILGRHLGEDPADLPEYNADVVPNDAIDDEDLAEVVKFMLLNPNYTF